MNIEIMILYSVWSLTIFSLILIPKKRWGEASIVFLFQQFVTWFLGLLVVEWRLIEYPVRELAQVNETSFTFEFFVYPVISIFFILYYPKLSSLPKRFLYTAAISSIITITEVVFEVYTDLIHYTGWQWYLTWSSVFLTLVLVRIFYNWFFKYDLREKNLSGMFKAVSRKINLKSGESSDKI